MGLIQQKRQEGGVAADRREQVDVDDPFPLADREVVGQSMGEDTDVIHDNIDVIHDDIDASEMCECGDLEVLRRI